MLVLLLLLLCDAVQCESLSSLPWQRLSACLRLPHAQTLNTKSTTCSVFPATFFLLPIMLTAPHSYYSDTAAS
uniref:Putative secreted peptide n=1 Tax=Anopheles braziliensis TaxID=58242 RepID=A0A2M3ZS32_9DIPT